MSKGLPATELCRGLRYTTGGVPYPALPGCIFPCCDSISTTHVQLKHESGVRTDLLAFDRVSKPELAIRHLLLTPVLHELAGVRRLNFSVTVY